MRGRLLIWETHHLGDAVMSLPFVRGAAETFETTVVCRPALANVYRAAGLPIKVISWEPFWSEGLSFWKRLCNFCSFLKLLPKLRRISADVAVCAWADFRVHLLSILVGIPRRVGPPTNEVTFYGSHLPWRAAKLRKSKQVIGILESILRRPIVTDPVTREESSHHMDVWALAASSLGFSPRYGFPWFPPPQPPPEAGLFAERARQFQLPIWAVHPGARTATKRWPLQNYMRVINEVLLPNGCAVILIDETQNVPFQEIGTHFCSVRTPSLNELFGVLNTVDRFLANDSFPAHAAAALGKSVWTIFSSADARIFAPFGNASRVIQKDICEYRPCLDHCLKSTPECLLAIDFGTVKEAIDNSFPPFLRDDRETTI